MEQILQLILPPNKKVIANLRHFPIGLIPLFHNGIVHLKYP